MSKAGIILMIASATALYVFGIVLLWFQAFSKYSEAQISIPLLLDIPLIWFLLGGIFVVIIVGLILWLRSKPLSHM